MATEIKVPTLGESITEATVSRWLRRPGETVALDEPVAELETDKVTLEVPAPVAGTLAEILAEEGTDVPVGAVLGRIADGAAAAPHPRTAPGLPSAATFELESPAGRTHNSPGAGPSLSPLARGGLSTPSPRLWGEGRGEGLAALQRSGPAVRKLIEETGLDATTVAPTGPGGRITKGDVIAVRTPAPAPSSPAPSAEQREVRVRMSRLRRRIAERLKAAQNTAAMLTTFNEIDMSLTTALREQYRDAFEKKHGVRLGFMSIFVKAAILALKELPAINAEIDGDDIVYKNYYDIGVAVGTEQGLVVPVVRDADRLSFAEIEKAIAEYGRKARDGKLAIDELSGGTFTISNGGIYGSLMSTPILNPPQAGILGMHKIERRPVAVGGQVEIRPMMYVALSYDHRIVDGREAVTFLVRVKECVEDPSRILFGI